MLRYRPSGIPLLGKVFTNSFLFQGLSEVSVRLSRQDCIYM